MAGTPGDPTTRIVIGSGKCVLRIVMLLIGCQPLFDEKRAASYPFTETPPLNPHRGSRRGLVWTVRSISRKLSELGENRSRSKVAPSCVSA